MKKKWMLFWTTLLLTALLLGGCGSLNSTSAMEDTINSAEDAVATEATQDEDLSTESVEEADLAEDIIYTPIEYEYTQDLNIIEDNYRNYYEIFVYSFYDSDGDGIGDIQGIISKLDYINDGNDETDTDLGFNGIWLMPIMPSTTYHKYDVTDYYSIDEQYGTMEDFKLLATECHKRNIKLIIDFVFNHTSAKHPWFTEAVSYLETLPEGEEPDLSVCPYVDYYNFTRENKGGDTYHRAGTSDFYYECMFWDQMPDLNLGNENLRAEIEKIASFWLDAGVDGFRLDAAKEFYSGQIEKNVEVLEWFSSYVTSVSQDAYLVAEVWEDTTYLSQYYESNITSLFDFPLSQHDGKIIKAARKTGNSSANSFVNAMITLQDTYGNINPGYIDAPFISNHDTTRVSAMCVNDENQMKMAAGMLLTMSGSPFVYYGEEIGMNSYGSKDENKRLPMQWSKTEFTGITQKPENADEVEQAFPAADQQSLDPLSLLNYYKRAVQIRNENPEIARGKVAAITELCGDDIAAVTKTYEDSTIGIVYNISDTPSSVDISNTALEGMSIRGYLTTDGSVITIDANQVTMPAYSILFLK